MSRDFPELTTIGSLFRFAIHLEAATLEVLELAVEKADDDSSGPLQKMLKKHKRRADEVERARREKLNETVLEPLMDMPNDPYIPNIPADFSDADHAALLGAALELHRCTAKFYDESVEKAGPVLAEVRRFFARLAKENAKHGKIIEGLL